MTTAEFCRTTLGLSYGQALLPVGALVLLCGLWLYAAGRRWPPGAARLAAVVAVVAVNALIPKLFCRWEDTVIVVILRCVVRKFQRRSIAALFAACCPST